MEVENPTRDHYPLRSNFGPLIHHKPYKISKELLTFEIKVTYMRIISSSVNMQSSMNLIFLPRDLHSCLQINGLKINPSEKISRPINRHRSDALMSESIYVNTDRIKFKGFSLPFEIQIQDSSSVLFSGYLKRNVSGLSSGGKDVCMWVMECKDGGITEFNGGSLVDVYFAGRSLGKPLLLNGLVELKRWKGLDLIPEDDETLNYNFMELGEKLNVGGFDDEHKYNKSALHSSGDHLDHVDDQILVEEEEVSWFNAGVRVGIGLGLGMCLGVGVGLGLIVRTYKTTSGTLRKFIL